MNNKKRKRFVVFFKISIKIENFSAFFSFFSKIFVEFVKKKIKIVFVVAVAVFSVVAVAVFFVVAVVVFFVVKMKISFKK